MIVLSFIRRVIKVSPFSGEGFRVGFVSNSSYKATASQQKEIIVVDVTIFG